MADNLHSPDFLDRLLAATGLPLYRLSAETGIKPSELKGMMRGSRMHLVPVDQDEVYEKLVAYADKRIGELMSIREEVRRKLALDRRRRAEDRKRFTDR